MKSVLVVAYYFPPTGGAGVQRTVKFVKYLPANGWRPVILTVSNPSVPAFDETLLADIEPSLEVVRTRTFEPSYKTKQSVSASSGGGKSATSGLKRFIRSLANLVLQPDPQILWLPTALKAGVALAKRDDISVIFVSAPPFSTLVLAALIGRFSGKPLVVDYRDEWDISNDVWENKQGSTFTHALQQRMQRFVLRTASHVVATTQLSTDALRTKVESAGGRASATCIYNGFDQGDLAALVQTQRQVHRGKLTITYVGTLWNLTSIEPVVVALQRLSQEHPELADSIELCVVGRKTNEQQAILETLQQTPVSMLLYDYVEHGQALQFMKDADVLLLLLSDMPVAARVMPGKTFEYLATGNAILAISPRGEVWKVLDGQADAVCLEPKQQTEMVDYFKGKLAEKALAPKVSEPRDISRFERSNLTAELADVLTAAAQTKRF